MSSFIVNPASLNWKKCSQLHENEEIWFADGLQAKGQWGATATKMILFRERTENDPPSEVNGMIAEEFPVESLMRAKILAWEKHQDELRKFLYAWFHVTDLDSLIKKFKEPKLNFFNEEPKDSLPKKFPYNKLNFLNEEPKDSLPKKFPYDFFLDKSTLNDADADPNITTGIDHG